jgi:DNA-binding NtrC family response regulator
MRDDFYYRLNVLTISLPPLRERREDIPELLHAFATDVSRKPRFTKDALAWLVARNWPGNVRELRNVVERVSVLAEGNRVDRAVLESLVADSPQCAETSDIDRVVDRIVALPGKLKENIDALERRVLARAFEASRGNQSAVARVFGMERRALARWWRRLGEESEDDDGDAEQ